MDKKSNMEFQDAFNFKSVEEALMIIVGNLASDIRTAIIEKYELPEDGVTQTVRECIERRTSAPDIILGRVSIKKEVKPVIDPATGEVKEKPGCLFTLVRGPRTGQTCRKPCTREYDYCSVHKRALMNRGELPPARSEVVFKSIPGFDDLFIYGGTRLIVTRDSYERGISTGNCEVIGVANADWQVSGLQIDKELSPKDIEFISAKGMKTSNIVA